MAGFFSTSSKRGESVLSRSFIQLSRREAIEAIKSVDGLSDLDRQLFANHIEAYENCDDTEIARRWFKHFGDIVVIGGSNYHQQTRSQSDQCSLTAQELISRVKQKACGPI